MPRTALHRRLVRFFVAIGLLPFLAGSASAGPTGFVYSLTQVSGGTNLIYGHRFDPTTATLTLIPGFPVTSGGTGTAAAAAEQLALGGDRLIVLNDGSDTMSVFKINRSTGALTPTPYSPFGLPDPVTWGAVAVHPSGSPVVVGDSTTGRLLSFNISDTAIGAAAGSPYTMGGANPFAIRFSQDGAFVYAGGNVGTTIAGFGVNAGTGVLTPLAGSPFASGSSAPASYATDNSGRLFISSIQASSELRAFTTSSGVPSAVSGNPFAATGLSQPVHGVLVAGSFYVVAARNSNNVGSFQIAGSGASTTLTAVAGSPFASGGVSTTALASTPDGRHLLAANGTSRNLTVFQVDTATGVLTSLGVQPADTLGATGRVTGLAFTPREDGFVYSLTQVDGGANQIYGFRINQSTGVLTLLPGFPMATGGIGGAGAFSGNMTHLNGRLYVVNEGDATFSAFKVNRTTGALTALPFSPTAFTGDGACVVVHPSGSPVVVGSNGGLHSFNVNATTAAAAAGSPFAAPGTSAFGCAFSADGSFVYSGGNVGSGISGYAVNANTGVLTELGGSPFASGAANPVGYAADAAGRLFVSSFGGGVRAFTSPSGALTAASGNPFASGLSGGVSGILNPLGFYVVADRSANQLGVFQVAGSGAATTLTAVAGSPFTTGGSFTDTLTQTSDGGLVVAANGVSRNLTVFHVNPTTGFLTLAHNQSANTLGASGLITGIAYASVVPPFTDDPVSAGMPIKAIHITDLRSRINSLRAQLGLAPFAYTDATLTVGVTNARALHVTELRNALAEVYTAGGASPPSYTDPSLLVGTTAVKAVHIMELRAAVMAIE